MLGEADAPGDYNNCGALGHGGSSEPVLVLQREAIWLVVTSVDSRAERRVRADKTARPPSAV